MKMKRTAPRVQTSAIPNDAIRRESISGKLTWESLNRYAGRPARAAVSPRWEKVLRDGAAAIAAATKMKVEDARAAMSRQAPAIASAIRLYLHEMKFRDRERRQLKDWLLGSRDVIDSLTASLKGLRRMVKELEAESPNPPDAWTSCADLTAGDEPAPSRSVFAILTSSRKRGRRELDKLLDDASELLGMAGNQPWVAHGLGWTRMVSDAIGRLPHEGRRPEFEQRNYVRRLAAIWRALTGMWITTSGNKRKKKGQDEPSLTPTPSRRFLEACFDLLPKRAPRPGDAAIRAIISEGPGRRVVRKSR